MICNGDIPLTWQTSFGGGVDLGQTGAPCMIPDLDIFRSAQTLVKQHGKDAPIHAVMRADELLEMGDVEGVYGRFALPR